MPAWFRLFACAFLIAVPTVHFAAAEEAADFGSSLQSEISAYQAGEDSLHGYFESLHSVPFTAAKFAAYRSEWREKWAAAKFDILEQQAKIDYLLLRNHLRYADILAKRESTKLDSVSQLVPFRLPIAELEQARLQMRPLDSGAAAALLADIPNQIKKIRERIEQGRKEKDEKKDSPKDSQADSAPLKVDRLHAKRALEATENSRQVLGSWFKNYDGYLPEFSWWMKKPQEDASHALEEYAKYLREEIAGIKGKDDDPIIGEPLGEEALKEELEHEVIAYDARELIAIAERQLAWCESQMKVASQEMGLGEDWKKALERVKEEHEPPGHQDQYIAQQAREAIDFVKTHDLVTVPRFCEDIWRINMIDTETQKTMPYAAYNHLNILAAYARQDMTNELKLSSMRGNNRPFLRIVTAHELIPGHHLQFYYADRFHSYRRLFGTSFYIEGWAVYWETRLWDLKFGRTPDERLGMLFWRMHRAARIIVTLKYHLGEMTAEQMIQFLIERIGHERAGATSEVRRYVIYNPLYQCGYLVGALQLRALHKEMVQSGKMTDRQFNDAVLKAGTMPIELLRAGMENLSLQATTEASWRFETEPR